MIILACCARWECGWWCDGVVVSRDNVCFLDEQTIVYPVGSTLVIYDVVTHEQRFIPGSQGADG
jgi:hypothetical protein